jgi:hypothetical protein
MADRARLSALALGATAILAALEALGTAGRAPARPAAEDRPAETVEDKEPSTKPAAENLPWQRVEGKGYAIYAPKGWRKMGFDMPNIPLYMNGDGIGAPAVDETGQPIQIGLDVERFRHQKGAAMDAAKRNLKNVDRNRRLQRIGKGSVTPLRLSDGTDAALLTVEFYKDRTRRSCVQKVFALDRKSTGWVVTAWIVCGRDSRFVKACPWAATRLRAHITSLCFDARKLTDERLRAAYSLAEKPTRPATKPSPTTRPSPATRPSPTTQPSRATLSVAS